jgi:hypothetical protein
MTEIERLLADLGLDIEVVHEGSGSHCPACEPATGAAPVPVAA